MAEPPAPDSENPPFGSPLLAYTSAIENPHLDLDLLRQVLIEANLTRPDAGNGGPRTEEIESYVCSNNKSQALLRKLFSRKLTSFVHPESGTGFYFVPISGYSFTIDKYIMSGGREIQFLRGVSCSTVFWVDTEYIIMTLIVDPREQPIAADDLTKLQHPRDLFIDDQSVAAIRGASPLFKNLGDLDRRKRSIGELMVELLLSILDAYCVKRNLSKEKRVGIVQSIRERSNATIRTSMFVSTVTIVGNLNNLTTLNRLANVIGGYNGLRYRDPTRFVDNLDISSTPNLRAMVSENRFLVAGEWDFFHSSDTFNNEREDWLTYGILTGEVFSSLTATQYRFHLRAGFGTTRGVVQQTRGQLIDLVALSTRLSDPNYVQTPLQRRIIARMIDSNKLIDSLKSMRDNLGLSHSISEGIGQRTVTVMVLVATVFLLIGTLIPQEFFGYYATIAIVALFMVFFVVPWLVVRADSVRGDP